MDSTSGTSIVETPIVIETPTLLETQIRDDWRINAPAIEREMERIAALLQKTIHFEARTSTPHGAATRHDAGAALIAACQR